MYLTNEELKAVTGGTSNQKKDLSKIECDL
ncbi:bacteriocin [Pseudoalteromonas sp. R3]|nr:bacteriocin [Pseudoalteromonas sp. R3]